MSRWTDAFNAYTKSITDSLIEQLAVVKADDISATNNVLEVIRLKKVINYIKEVLNSLDPELIPLTSLEPYNQQAKACLGSIASYQIDRNIVHLQNANTYADNMLNYIRPYLIVQGKVKSAQENIYSKTKKDLEKQLESFQDLASSNLSEIKEILNKSTQSQSEVNRILEKIQTLNIELFGDERNNSAKESIKSQLKKLYEELAKHSAEIKNYHAALLIDSTKSKSTRTEIEEARAQIVDDQDTVSILAKGVKSEVDELKDFYIRIFGKLNDADVRVGGLSEELTTRLTILNELEKTNITQYDTILTKIKSLLPSATSAGLASAYNEMKLSYTKDIKLYGNGFFASIGLFIMVTLYVNTKFISENIDGKVVSTVQSFKFDSIEVALAENLFKLPLYGALIWVAFFTSKRRSEAQRLQQEYAHKEALAKSYGSYKEQLEALDLEDKELQKDFIKKTVDAIAYNASQTLDGKHGDDYPAKELLEKVLEKLPNVSMDDLKDFFKKKAKDTD